MAWWAVYQNTTFMIGWAAIIGNVLILACLGCLSYLRESTTHMLIGFVAGCDLMHGLALGLVYSFAPYISSYDKLVYFCRVGYVIEHTGNLSECIVLSVLALERRNSLLSTIGSSTKWKTRTVSIFVTVMSIAMAIYSVYVGTFSLPAANATCLAFLQPLPVYYYAAAYVLGLLTCAIIICSYTHIAYLRCTGSMQVISF